MACYSIDGGTTSLVRMNQVGGGSDYGDFATTSPNIPYIQDAFYPGTTNVYSILSPEFTMLESIGYDPLMPEPVEPRALFAERGDGVSAGCAVGDTGWTLSPRAKRNVSRREFGGQTACHG